MAAKKKSAKKSRKKWQSHRHVGRSETPSLSQLAGLGRKALVVHLKRLKPRTKTEEISRLSREQLLAKVVAAYRPKKNPLKKYEGMTRAQLLAIITNKKKQFKKSKKRGKQASKTESEAERKAREHAAYAASFSKMPSQNEEWASAKYNDPGRKMKKSSSKAKKKSSSKAKKKYSSKRKRLSAWASFVKYNAGKAKYKKYSTARSRMKALSADYKAGHRKTSSRKKKNSPYKKSSRKNPRKRKSSRDYGWYE